MNAEAICLEKRLRMIRDRILYEIGPNIRDGCISIYVLDVGIDTIETSTSAEIAYDLGIPSTLPQRSGARTVGGVPSDRGAG